MNINLTSTITAFDVQEKEFISFKRQLKTLKDLELSHLSHERC